jgi:hypothetical protein
MQPFRAPRKRAQKKGTVLQDNDIETRSDNASPSRRSPRRKGKSETEVHVVPYIKGIKMMSERESNETAQHGEVLRWSNDSEGEDQGGSKKTDLNVQDEFESEELTEFGVVWERFVIPETEAGDIDRTGDERDAKTDRDEVHGNGSH